MPSPAKLVETQGRLGAGIPVGLPEDRPHHGPTGHLADSLRTARLPNIHPHMDTDRPVT